MNEIENRPIESLVVHPLNIQLHGDDPDVYDLVISIPEYGLKEPLLITSDGQIVDGRRRFKALNILEWETVPCEVDPELDSDDDKVFQRILIADQQKDKSPRYIYYASKRLMELETEKAKQRQAHGKTAPGKTLGVISPQASERAPRARDIVAQFFNIGQYTLRHIWDIYDNEEEFPKVVKLLDEGKISINSAWEKIKGIRQKESKFQERKAEFFKVVARVRRTSLREFLLNKYATDESVRKTSIEDLKKEIFIMLGVPVGETFIERWRTICKSIMDTVEEETLSSEHFRTSRWPSGSRRYQQVTWHMDESEGVPPLEFASFRGSTFVDFEEADAWAKERGGFCEGLGDYGGLPYWRFMIRKEPEEEVEEEE